MLAGAGEVVFRGLVLPWLLWAQCARPAGGVSRPALELFGTKGGKKVPVPVCSLGWAPVSEWVTNHAAPLFLMLLCTFPFS